MPQPIRTPRVNNNDDVVKLSHLFVEVGSKIRTGDPILDVETDKATFTLESELDGYLLAVNSQVGEMLAVGSVIAWVGRTPDEPLAEQTHAQSAPDERKGPSLKSLLLLKQQRTQPAEAPGLPGRTVPFTPEARGMSRTVSWQREHAAAAYLDITYDPAPWQAYAAAFQKKGGLWYDPQLALICYRLARLGAEQPRINGTVSSDGAYLYDQVNLGFTVQADSTLYLVVIKNAAAMDEATFVRELSGLQMSAVRRALTAEQTSDATLSFSSMARWNVSRHMPILPPRTALIVAHTAPENGVARLGATYDHRLLTGFDVVHALQALASPPQERPA